MPMALRTEANETRKKRRESGDCATVASTITKLTTKTTIKTGAGVPKSIPDEATPNIEANLEAELGKNRWQNKTANGAPTTNDVRTVVSAVHTMNPMGSNGGEES